MTMFSSILETYFPAPQRREFGEWLGNVTSSVGHYAQNILQEIASPAQPQSLQENETIEPVEYDKTQLLGLPIEVLHHIVLYLTPEDIVSSLDGVCRDMFSFTHSEALWRGLVDRDFPSLPILHSTPSYSSPSPTALPSLSIFRSRHLYHYILNYKHRHHQPLALPASPWNTLIGRMPTSLTQQYYLKVPLLGQKARRILYCMIEQSMFPHVVIKAKGRGVGAGVGMQVGARTMCLSALIDFYTEEAWPQVLSFIRQADALIFMLMTEQDLVIQTRDLWSFLGVIREKQAAPESHGQAQGYRKVPILVFVCRSVGKSAAEVVKRMNLEEESVWCVVEMENESSVEEIKMGMEWLSSQL